MHRVLALCLALASCSDDEALPATADPDTANDEGGKPAVDARVEASKRDAGPSTMRDARIDASRPRSPTCESGHYEGHFDCTISGLLPWSGRMAFELVEDASGAGEFQTLSIAAGTTIASDQDSMGGTFTGELAADFDCRTGQLEGDLAHGKYLFLGAMEYNFEGPLQGSYRADGGTPGFDGKLGPLTSPDFGGFSPTADCTWTASLSGSAPLTPP